jgi:4-diphosphocytidyl-2-C-methyl-D-erythritol kinase
VTGWPGHRQCFLHAVSSVVQSCPAKLNLLLAVTGRRPDGFHELVSVVAPVEFGDTLTVEPAADFSLSCDDPTVATGESNLVLKAAEAFRAATGWKGGAKFILAKRTPTGAGLGGGSSDAAAALKALNQLAGGMVAAPALAQIAASVGSDCALFLPGGPVVLRGRGERVERLREAAAGALRGRRVLIFKPAFAIPTPWAYTALAAQSRRGYRPGAEAEARVSAFIHTASTRGELDPLLFNDFERVVFAKFVALPVLSEQLRQKYGLVTRLTGSGSACFAFLPTDAPLADIIASVRAAWGESAFVIETRLA